MRLIKEKRKCTTKLYDDLTRLRITRVYISNTSPINYEIDEEKKEKKTMLNFMMI
jgi:hypothetical protein